MLRVKKRLNTESRHGFHVLCNIFKKKKNKYQMASS